MKDLNNTLLHYYIKFNSIAFIFSLCVLFLLNFIERDVTFREMFIINILLVIILSIGVGYSLFICKSLHNVVLLLPVRIYSLFISLVPLIAYCIFDMILFYNYFNDCLVNLKSLSFILSLISIIILIVVFVNGFRTTSYNVNDN